jgi:hypothetical protein
MVNSPQWLGGGGQPPLRRRSLFAGHERSRVLAIKDTFLEYCPSLQDMLMSEMGLLKFFKSRAWRARFTPDSFRSWVFQSSFDLCSFNFDWEVGMGARRLDGM